MLTVSFLHSTPRDVVKSNDKLVPRLQSWQKSVCLVGALTLGVLAILYGQYRSSPGVDNATNINSLLQRYVGEQRKFEYPRDAYDYTLSDKQCRASFPRLFDEINRAERDRNGSKVSFDDLEAVELGYGYLRAMIHENQLYVLGVGDTVYSRSFAVLLSIHRAILTNPPGSPPLPNTEFVINFDDRHLTAPVWTFTRQPNDTLAWLIPDFGFWSWPEPKVGSYGEVVRSALAMEESAEENPTGKKWDWQSKRPQIVWRGATLDLEQRLGLVTYTRDKTWADVKELVWNNHETMKTDLKTMAEHCQYKFVAHTEGRSYSGRLKYLQNCRSVVISHPQEWVTHVSHLMTSEPGSMEQNYVEVARNFSDLESAIQDLLENDKEAARIADNSVRTFRERYLTSAAETCYWRQLIRSWRDASFEPEGLEEMPIGKGLNASSGRKMRGVPFESYILERRMAWNPY